MTNSYDRDWAEAEFVSWKLKEALLAYCAIANPDLSTPEGIGAIASVAEAVLSGLLPAPTGRIVSARITDVVTTDKSWSASLIINEGIKEIELSLACDEDGK